jgi:hypothetical protein
MLKNHKNGIPLKADILLADNIFTLKKKVTFVSVICKTQPFK